MEEPSSSQTEKIVKLETIDDPGSFEIEMKSLSSPTNLVAQQSQPISSVDNSQSTSSSLLQQQAQPQSSPTKFSSTTSSVLLSSFSPSKFSQLNGNKITIVPLGNTSGNAMPIKRVVQVNAGSNAPVSSLLSSSPNRAINVTSLNSANLIEKSPNKIITSINSNSGNASKNANLTANSSNKIQYVKIVNMGSLNSSNQNTNTTNSTNSNNNTNVTQINAANSNNATSAVITNSTGFKITTINANANNGNSTNLQDGTNRSLSTIISSINARPTLVTGTKTSETSSTSVASSALADAINYGMPTSAETINSPPTTLKPTTYQLINVNPTSSIQSSSPRITTTTTMTTIPLSANSAINKSAPVIQRIQSIQSTNSNQPITKTIVSASTTNTSSSNSNNSNISAMIPQPTSSNYKVLSQQLPSSNMSTTPVITQINSLKSLSTNTKIQNPIVITKTVSNSGNNIYSSNSDLNNESSALNNINRKQIITSVKSDSKRPIITTTTTTTTATPITLTPIANSNNNNNSFNNSVSLSTRSEGNNNSSNLNVQGMENDTNKSLTDTSNQKNYYPTSNNNSSIRLASTLSSISNQTSLNKSYENFPPNPFLNSTTHPYPVNLNQSQSLYQPLNNYQSNTQNTQSASLNSSLSSNIRKPCNCTKSMCLKLYCDCFAIGSFCHDCNCINCYNTLEHEDERNKAIKMVLDRNPQAFQSKIGKFTTPITQSKAALPDQVAAAPIIEETAPTITSEEIDEIQSRHIKGCNCKKSNCLKRYCECYLAKIQCSTLCKCVGCKNCDESTKSLLELANAADQRKLQQTQNSSNFQNHQMQSSQLLHTNSQNLFSSKQNSFSMNRPSFLWSHNPSSFLGSDLASKSFNGLDMLNSYQKTQLEHQQTLNNSYATLTDQAVEITCARLINCVAEKLEFLKKQEDSIENKEKINCDELMESLVIEEFGRCLADIIEKAEHRKS